MTETEKRRLSSRSNSAKMIQVIEVVTVAGNGTPENPYRGIREYWSPSGDLLAVKYSEDPAGLPEEHRMREHFSTAECHGSLNGDRSKQTVIETLCSSQH